MGSIDLHQSAGLCAQPEASQDNPQNLSTARTTMPCYVYQTFFSHPHKKEKKRSGYARLPQHYKGLVHFMNQKKFQIHSGWGCKLAHMIYFEANSHWSITFLFPDRVMIT